MGTETTTTITTRDTPDDGPEKEYHNRFRGSSFYMPNGEQVVFDHNGLLKTTKLAVQKELDKIANKPGSPVFTGDAPVPEPNENKPSEDVKDIAANAMAQLRAQQAKLGGAPI